MSDLVIRPLVAGEENLFESMPDPLPQLRQVGYADGIAGGGYRPENTWVALRDGRVVGRAAWVLPPGAVGAPWLERFDLDAEPEVGAALLRAAHEAFGGPRLYYAAAPAHWLRSAWPARRSPRRPPTRRQSTRQDWDTAARSSISTATSPTSPPGPGTCCGTAALTANGISEP